MLSSMETCRIFLNNEQIKAWQKIYVTTKISYLVLRDMNHVIIWQNEK
jgi:hypothetical protein